MVDPDSGRHGVDEHADHRLHTGQVGGAPGHRAAEDHVRFTAVGRQQQCPCALDHGVHGQPVPPGHRADLTGDLDAHRCRRLGAVRLLRRPVVGQRGRHLEPGQHATPVRLRLGQVLTGEPFEVVPERPAGHQLRRPVPHDRRVLLADLGEHLAEAPAVQQHVVEGPDQ